MASGAAKHVFLVEKMSMQETCVLQIFKKVIILSLPPPPRAGHASSMSSLSGCCKQPACKLTNQPTNDHHAFMCC